jgi:hypothetical protein
VREHVYVARLAGREVGAVRPPREGSVGKLAAAEVADPSRGGVREALLGRPVGLGQDLGQADRAHVVAGAVALLDERRDRAILAAPVAALGLLIRY